MRNLPPALIAAKNQRPGGPWCWLAEVRPVESQVIRVTTNTDPIEFGGETFRPFPFEVGEITDDGEGNLHTIPITVDNATAELSGLDAELTGLVDARVTLWFVHAEHAGEGDYAFRVELRVSQATVDGQTGLTAELAAEPLVSRTTPVAILLEGRCRHTYGGADCGYPTDLPGALPTCDRSLWGENGCIAHGDHAEAELGIPRRHPERYGGFETIPG